MLVPVIDHLFAIGGIRQAIWRLWYPLLTRRLRDEAVLFLQPSTMDDGTLIVTGLVQGNFKMLRQPSGAVMVSNGVPDVSAVEQRTSTPLEYRGAKISIQDLEQRVRKAQEQ